VGRGRCPAIIHCCSDTSHFGPQRIGRISHGRAFLPGFSLPYLIQAVFDVVLDKGTNGGVMFSMLSRQKISNACSQVRPKCLTTGSGRCMLVGDIPLLPSLNVMTLDWGWACGFHSELRPNDSGLCMVFHSGLDLTLRRRRKWRCDARFQHPPTYVLVVIKWNAADPCAKTHSMREPCQTYSVGSFPVQLRDFLRLQRRRLRGRQLVNEGFA